MSSSAELLKGRFYEKYGCPPEVIAAAPGRVEVIGNHTDYNKGPVIGAAIDRETRVALRRISEPAFRFASENSQSVELFDPSQRQSGAGSWVNYLLGVYNVLLRKGLEASGGLEVLVDSDVPAGAGLSSSAALELSMAKALAEAYGLELTTEELAFAGREAENGFVGVPCGILDQGVSAFGKAGRLVYIDCRNMAFETIPLGDGFSIWIYNTHKKHSLVESLYAKRHEECHVAVEQLKSAGLPIECLADVSVEAFEAKKAFLDPIAAKRAAHVVYEIERVERARTLFCKGDVESAGKLLFASHASSRDLFENSIEELDYLQRILQSMPGVLGARLTGGGFGGAVMALAKEGFSENYAASVAGAYRGRFGEAPELIRCGLADGARVLEGLEA